MSDILPFPDIPKGSPGEIDGGAADLSRCAQELEAAATQTAQGEGSLAGSWEGEAATAYHASAGHLAAAVRGVAGLLRESAVAARAYAGELDRAQSAMRRLRHLYDDAVRRARSAQTHLDSLAGEMSTATHARARTLTGQITTAANAEVTATNDANQYAIAALRLAGDFARESDHTVGQMITGQKAGDDWLTNPKADAPTPGVPPGLSFPGGGAEGVRGSLAAYGGVLTIAVQGRRGVFGEIETVSGAVGGLAGVCDALGFWDPVTALGCGGTSLIAGGVSVAAGWLRDLTHEPGGSPGDALLNTVLAGVGVGGAGLALKGGALARSGEGTARLIGPALRATGAQIGGGASAISLGLTPKSIRQLLDETGHPVIVGAGGEVDG